MEARAFEFWATQHVVSCGDNRALATKSDLPLLRRASVASVLTHHQGGHKNGRPCGVPSRLSNRSGHILLLVQKKMEMFQVHPLLKTGG